MYTSTFSADGETCFASVVIYLLYVKVSPQPTLVGCISVVVANPTTDASFRWADLPVKPEDINDPISVCEWLMDTAPAPPPPKYCDSLKDFHERQETVKIDVPDTNQVQHSEPWISPIEPPPALQHWQKSFQDEETCVKPKRTDYELSDNVRKRYNKIGLF